MVGENSSRRPSCLLAGGIFSIMYPARRLSLQPRRNGKKRGPPPRYVYADNKEISPCPRGTAGAAFCALPVSRISGRAAVREFLCDNFGAADTFVVRPA